MHRLLLIMLAGAIMAGFSYKVDAQENTLPEVKSIEKNFAKNVDDLLQQHYIEKSGFITQETKYSGRDTSAPVYSDSIYIERIRNIQSVIDLSYNQIVRNFIHVYTVERRDKVKIMLGLKEYYFPIFEKIFDQYGLPLELKYLAVIESALNPEAVSRAGATGLWQFMYGTGKLYGLTINSFVDERRDPLKSTYAAAKYLKDLYEIFGEWDLAIAAYNCGPTNVKKAIYRAGGKKNFWDIYYYLPYETRGYFPALVAAMYMMNYHEDHNLYREAIELPHLTDTIHVHQKLHLKQVSQVLNIPLKQLQDLNPQYRKDLLPASKQNTFSLKLPMKNTGRFIQLQDSIYSYKDSVFFREDILKEPQRSRFVHQTPQGKAKIYYEVKSGDNLGYIAEWFNVRASQLRNWNNMRGSMIRTGQKLVVYVPKDKVSYYKKLNSLSFAEKQKRIGEPAEKQTQVKEENDLDKDYIYYKVKYGDTLWDIARKYPGVTEKDLIKLNNLPNERKIKAGQYLKIKEKT
ncbi:MAG: LysM peptidoglycan-binding domain-containing protein [Bacteroidales bacterium]|nr:LysM peptidoglycan-binding domain-containing protein [Bacteroidales bacterium]